MQKNKMMRTASVLLVAVLLSTCAISGTFAKYTTTQTVTDSARVAKWDIDFDADNNASKTFAFDLFNTVYEADGTSVETDVANNTTDGKTVIAPGTGGSFTISLKNLSEVSAKYSITYSVTANNVPLEFTTVKSGQWKSTIDSVTDQDLAMNASQSTDTTIYWRWAFTDGQDNNRDSEDTKLGANANLPEVTVTATVTVEQVD